MAFDRSRRRKCTSAARVTASVLLSFLTLAPHSAAAWGFDAQQPMMPNYPAPSRQHAGDASGDIFTTTDPTFTLRHVFHRGAKKYPSLHRRLDVSPNKVQAALRGESDEEDGIGPFHFKSTTLDILRLTPAAYADLRPMEEAAERYGATVTMPDDAWFLDEVVSPNITDKKTVVNLSLMAASAYNKDNEDPEWEDIRPPFNLTNDIGWEQDGLRGHVFANEDNSTIVVAIKGTTSALFDGAETTTNDKENDNLFAGCCCGQGGHLSYRQVCDCMTDTKTCNDTCVEKNIRAPHRYYPASRDLYGNITELYPEATVWLTGHSLGGMVTGLLGLRVGMPVVTFEAVPQQLAASRLGIPVPPGYKTAIEARGGVGIWNFGHTADPVYMGACNAFSSLCTFWGYALETQCHLGARCVYDTVDEWKWRQSLVSHGIRGCVKDVYKAWEGVPTCEVETDCEDCFQWTRYRSNGSEITTTASTTSTTSTWSTRTETCKTPGWWGCRDDLTTTSDEPQRSTSTTTLTTETCVERGWFGQCLTSVTTTITSRTTLPVTVTTTRSTTTTTTTREKGSASRKKSHRPTAAPTTSCETPGYFWGCKDESATATTTTAAASPTITDPPESKWEQPEHDMIL